MARLVPALVLLALLAACDQRSASGPFAESRTPPMLGSRFFPPDGWAWGYLKLGDAPIQRYGTAPALHTTRGDLVIVPAQGEIAETWFETAADLSRAGYRVWVLDRAGQGGSGRYALPRDMAHAPGLDVEAVALKALVNVVVRPPRPVLVLAAGDGAVVALLAAEDGLDAAGLMLSNPQLVTPAKGAQSAWAMLPYSDRLPAAGWRPWSRRRPTDYDLQRTHDPWRGGVTHAWMTANPDLRSSGPSLGLETAQAAGAAKARLAATGVRAPVLFLATRPLDNRLQALRVALPDAEVQVIAGARTALHLEADRWRDPWRRAVLDFAARAQGDHGL